MRLSSKVLLALVAAMSFSQLAFSSAIQKIEISRPYVGVGCSASELNHPFELGMFLTNIQVSQEAPQAEGSEKLVFVINQKLSLCTVAINSDGVKEYSWTDVNPFDGYDVPFYNARTKQMDIRHEVIAPTTKGNRFEMGLYDAGTEILAPLTVSRNGFSGILKVSKDKILKAADLEALERGETVKKVVEIYTNLNVTTTVGAMTYLFGDVYFSGRNVALYFVKSNGVVELRSISL